MDINSFALGNDLIRPSGVGFLPAFSCPVPWTTLSLRLELRLLEGSQSLVQLSPHKIVCTFHNKHRTQAVNINSLPDNFFDYDRILAMNVPEVTASSIEKELDEEIQQQEQQLAIVRNGFRLYVKALHLPDARTFHYSEHIEKLFIQHAKRWGKQGKLRRAHKTWEQREQWVLELHCPEAKGLKESIESLKANKKRNAKLLEFGRKLDVARAAKEGSNHLTPAEEQIHAANSTTTKEDQLPDGKGSKGPAGPANLLDQEERSDHTEGVTGSFNALSAMEEADLSGNAQG